MATAVALQVTLPSGGEANLPLVDEDLDVVIDQQHATTQLRHMYHNSSGSQLEGRFAFAGGSGAMVKGFAYWNGDQKIVGEVFEKSIATQIYQGTVDRRRDPGLLVKTGEGAFAFRVFPIEPGEHKRIQLEVDEWLPRTTDSVEYRVPVSRGDAEVRIEIRDDRPIGSVVSTSHKLDVERRDGGVVVKVREMLGTRRELVLRYQLLDPPWTLSTAVHRDVDHDGYLMLSLPAPPGQGVVAKDVTLVIDRSGSMMGEPLTHAKAAARQVVDQLGERDRFNVLTFDSRVDALFKVPEPVTAKSKERARMFIDRLDEGGGTDIALALQSAFAKQHADTRPKTVIFLTDGKSSSQAALAVAQRDTSDARVFTVGLGDKVDKPLLSRLAGVKRGRFTHVESASTLVTRLRKLYSNIASPALVGVRLDVEGGDANLYRTYPRSLPDIFNGDELLVVTRIQGAGSVKLVVSGRTANGPIRVERVVALPPRASRRWVGRLWARSRVDHLLEEMALAGTTPELVAETKELGLAYDLLTPYTAFLAVPESELSSEGKDLLQRARNDKDEALAFNPDAQALRSPSSPIDLAQDSLAGPPPEQVRGPGLSGCGRCSYENRSPEPVDIGTWLLLVGLLRLRRQRPGRRRP